ncbi:hypothetical protein [Chitinilyticum piscinae]|uniref:Uncharacterized protein n=1 Tax=Chitinilyticum piscinae TaxID=2866724 RepID=A0A8J7KGY4_9NEIS|nr:hypothetical protein [Chitinilyticum piscinae]MBE9610869.1 hypothetical protein [Chitinilyticum piscinae]
MSGWWFTVSLGSAPVDSMEGKKAPVLASWEDGLDIAWLSKLVETGRAIRLPDDKSHLREVYSAKANCVLPILSELHERVTFQASIRQFNKDLIDTCAADQTLTIELWDMG